MLYFCSILNIEHFKIHPLRKVSGTIVNCIQWLLYQIFKITHILDGLFELKPLLITAANFLKLFSKKCVHVLCM